jgi:hypothetical protein
MVIWVRISLLFRRTQRADKSLNSSSRRPSARSSPSRSDGAKPVRERKSPCRARHRKLERRVAGLCGGRARPIGDRWSSIQIFSRVFSSCKRATSVSSAERSSGTNLQAQPASLRPHSDTWPVRVSSPQHAVGHRIEDEAAILPVGRRRLRRCGHESGERQSNGKDEQAHDVFTSASDHSIGPLRRRQGGLPRLMDGTTQPLWARRRWSPHSARYHTMTSSHRRTDGYPATVRVVSAARSSPISTFRANRRY